MNVFPLYAETVQGAYFCTLMHHPSTAKISEFDNNPDLLNTLDGVVNLRTGEVELHKSIKAVSLVSNSTGTVYRPEAC